VVFISLTLLFRGPVGKADLEHLVDMGPQADHGADTVVYICFVSDITDVR